MNSLSPIHHPPPLLPPPTIDGTNFGNKISPSILIIIVILAAILFISGLIHLLVRYLLRSSSSDPLASSSSEDATVLQGQLRQLFHLHDAGVDQSFIDALPVFVYKSIVGRRDGGDPFDCVFCLCEFEPDDKLRLLPKCSHAFHLHCIDTWLLSHSTCPLCRRSLIPEFPPSAASCSPVLLLFESGGESSRSIRLDRSDSGLNPDLGFVENGENFIPIIVQDESKEESEAVDSMVVSVKLGTFKNVSEIEGGGEGSGGGGINLDRRRCLSMGSYEYVMDDTSTLQVAIKPLSKNHHYQPSSKNRLAMSECDRHSKREGFKSIIDTQPPSTSSSVGGSLLRGESFSFSKIWLRKPKASVDSSRRWASSFRKANDGSKVNCQSSPSGSDFITAASERSKSEIDFDLEVGSCNNSIGSFAEEAPSFSRRTMLWILGRQNKVGNHG